MSNYSNSSYDDKNENTSWYKVLGLIPDSSTVLDIGCSSGHFGKELITRKHCVVDGVELDEQDVLQAKKFLRNVYSLNIETSDLGVITQKYDVIYMGDVVEHLFHAVNTLKRCRSLLKSNGVFIFSIPNMAHLSIRLLLLKGDFEYTETGLLDKTHVHFFNMKEIYRVFEEAGYSIDHLDYTKKDYPDDLVKQYCEELGIKASKKFLDMCRAVDSAAFQFIGVAKPSVVKKHKLKQFGPIDFFEKFYQDTVESYEIQIAQHKDRIAYLEAEINAIKTTKGYVVQKKLQNIIKYKNT